MPFNQEVCRTTRHNFLSHCESFWCLGSVNLARIFNPIELPPSMVPIFERMEVARWWTDSLKVRFSYEDNAETHAGLHLPSV